MSFLSQIFTPLLKGNITENPAKMKRFQNGTNVAVAVGTLVGVLVPSVQPYVTPEVITSVAGVVSAVNVYATTASTDKIGL